MCLFLVNHSLIHFYQERGSNFYAHNSDVTIQAQVQLSCNFVGKKLATNAVYIVVKKWATIYIVISRLLLSHEETPVDVTDM